MNTFSKKAVINFSGGPDSLANVIDLQRQGYKITLIHRIDKRMRLFEQSETLSAFKLAAELNINIIGIPLEWAHSKESSAWRDYIDLMARNVAPYCEDADRMIWVSRCFDDDYLWGDDDMFDEALTIAQQHIPQAELGPIRTKTAALEIVGLKLFEQTWSCEAGRELLIPCGRCNKCKLRKQVIENRMSGQAIIF